MPTPAEFLTEIREVGLLAPELERELHAANLPDAATMAKFLHDRGGLTGYQIQRIAQGKGKTLLVGPYVLLEVIGEGGMGRVYRARHTRMGREVALKVIRKERLNTPVVIQRFHQEVRAVGQMVHPNIVLAFDADTVGAVSYMAMELIEGIDLKAMVKAHGPMPMHVACEYVRQTALALQHAFELGTVHRDVKPSNLMVTKLGVVKLLDLGLAMLNNPEAADPLMTRDGVMLGTPDFAAPEQARNPHGVDTRADLYALGGTLYYFLTGQIPYEAPTPTAKVMRHVNEPPPSVRLLRPDLPPQLEALIQWLMAKDPNHRPQTPIEAAAALQPFCMPMPLPMVAPPPEPEVFVVPDEDTSPESKAKPLPKKSSGLFTVLAIVAFVIVLCGAAYLMKQWKIF